MSAILAGHKGVLCHMDDIFIFGRDQGEHDPRLAAALRSIQAAGVTLNADKCLFSQTSISSLGHIIDHRMGFRPTLENGRGLADDHTLQYHRTSLVLRNGEPTWEVFTQPCLDSRPLLELLGKHRCWTWGPTQVALFQHIKEELAKPSILVLDDTTVQTKISADASAYGLGAVLLLQLLLPTMSQ